MGSNRQEEGGAIWKYTRKIKHSKIKIDNVFDITEVYSLIIQNMRIIYLLGFSIQ